MLLRTSVLVLLVSLWISSAESMYIPDDLIKKARNGEWMFYTAPDGRVKKLLIVRGDRTGLDNMEAFEAKCREKDGVLAEIASQEENDFIYGLVDAAFLYGHRSDYKGNFILTALRNMKWRDGRYPEYTNWNAYKGAYNCGQYYPYDSCGVIYMGKPDEGKVNEWCITLCSDIENSPRNFAACEPMPE